MTMTRATLAATEADLNDLEEVWSELDVPGHRVEIIDGQIVVSPRVSIRHSVAVDRLIKQLFDVMRQHSWHPRIWQQPVLRGRPAA